MVLENKVDVGVENPSQISESTLMRIFEIEQDMWARWIWEYLQCTNCDEIFSKDDMFWKKWYAIFPTALQKETVMAIEKYLGGRTLQCKCCGWDTKHIYDIDTYLDEIRWRYNMEDSYLSVARNRDGEVIGFMDWYIATLDEIFENEFKYHFSPNLLDMLYEKYKAHRQRRMLTVSSIWTDDKNKSLITVFALLREFFSQFDNTYDETAWIVESIIGSSTYSILNIMWAQQARVGQKKWLILEWTQNPKFTTDILFQEGVIGAYKNHFNIRARDVVLYSRQTNQWLYA